MIGVNRFAIKYNVVVLLNPDGGATSTSSSTTTNVVVGVLALCYPLVKLLRAAPHSEVTRPCAGDDT